MYEFDLYFCFIDFMIHFTDFVQFLSPCIGYRLDTLQTLTYRQDRFSSLIHECIQSVFLLHFLIFLSFCMGLWHDNTWDTYVDKNI